MKKMKKLSLNRETIATLSPEGLRSIAGAAPQSVFSECPTVCATDFWCVSAGCGG